VRCAFGRAADSSHATDMLVCREAVFWHKAADVCALLECGMSCAQHKPSSRLLIRFFIRFSAAFGRKLRYLFAKIMHPRTQTADPASKMRLARGIGRRQSQVWFLLTISLERKRPFLAFRQLRHECRLQPHAIAGSVERHAVLILDAAVHGNIDADGFVRLEQRQGEVAVCLAHVVPRGAEGLVVR
jgi:hypothetical protein